MIRDRPMDIRTRNLQKERQNGERMPVLILVFSPGTSSTSLEAGLEPNRLSLDLDSLDGFISNVAMLTLKFM
jgi:hypothetical protein